jgi:hypothetical protein
MKKIARITAIITFVLISTLTNAAIMTKVYTTGAYTHIEFINDNTSTILHDSINILDTLPLMNIYIKQNTTYRISNPKTIYLTNLNNNIACYEVSFKLGYTDVYGRLQYLYLRVISDIYNNKIILASNTQYNMTIQYKPNQIRDGKICTMSYIKYQPYYKYAQYKPTPRQIEIDNELKIYQDLIKDKSVSISSQNDSISKLTSIKDSILNIISNLKTIDTVHITQYVNKDTDVITSSKITKITDYNIYITQTIDNANSIVDIFNNVNHVINIKFDNVVDYKFYTKNDVEITKE